jgi:hypothetical protein
MNWKTLLVIASLSLTTGLTACSSNDAGAPKTDTTAPAATTETKPATEAPKADGMKGDATKTTKTETSTETKPADGAKTDATKTTKTETTQTKPADAPKKP